MPRAAHPALVALGVILGLGASTPVHAVLDIGDRGPLLRAGNFRMRITNAGIIGNAFYDVGRSSDPSFEFPANSGVECLAHAELWVGAIDEQHQVRVSGGPELEWRPTLSPADTVREVWQGRLGTRRGVDDDGDGATDEEILNDRDDDGDSEIDEDLGVPSQQMLVADYTDYEASAVNFGYPTGEQHVPLGLSVHQDSYAWSTPGYRGIAGFQFTITNRGTQTLRNVYIGLHADLDSRRRSEPAGHANDRVERGAYSVFLGEEFFQLTAVGFYLNATRQDSAPFIRCVRGKSDGLLVLRDGVLGSAMPWSAVVPLDHTIDPLGFVDQSLARAPTKAIFGKRLLSRSLPPDRGGVPRLDADRYAVLAGTAPGFATLPTTEADYTTVVSCGPFSILRPGESLDFAVALVAGESLDSLTVAMTNAARLQAGTMLNLMPDSTGIGAIEWDVGNTGINGHEVCLEAPAGTTFDFDPHCSVELFNAGLAVPPDFHVTYRSGTCIWTNADCDLCTGVNGFESFLRWIDPGTIPPSPTFRATAGDGAITIGWDNLPEILLNAGEIGLPGSRFLGYKLYKLADWRGRAASLPPQYSWALYGSYGVDSIWGAMALASITDSTVDYVRTLYRQKQYEVGYYQIVDREVKNGFDYVYAVSTYGERAYYGQDGQIAVERFESPIAAVFDDRVSPQSSAKAGSGQAWVVPNPYRGSAEWDRPPVLGDTFTRHVDFMGLPQERCTIKIWTVAGDFVAQIDHDGTRGDGQASWNLISRNGQDVVSGIYLFTIASPTGHQRGRFVVIR